MSPTMTESRKPGRPPKGGKPMDRSKDRHTRPKLSFHVQREMLDVLEQYRRSLPHSTDRSAILADALEYFLVSKGLWPPTAE